MVDTLHDQKIAKTYAGMIRGAKEAAGAPSRLASWEVFPWWPSVKASRPPSPTLRRMEFEPAGPGGGTPTGWRAGPGTRARVGEGSATLEKLEHARRAWA